MHLVDFGDLLGILKGIDYELKRFIEMPSKVIKERLNASHFILEKYSLKEEQECCLKTWTYLCPPIK